MASRKALGIGQRCCNELASVRATLAHRDKRVEWQRKPRSVTSHWQKWLSRGSNYRCLPVRHASHLSVNALLQIRNSSSEKRIITMTLDPSHSHLGLPRHKYTAITLTSPVLVIPACRRHPPDTLISGPDPQCMSVNLASKSLTLVCVSTGSI